MRRSTIVERLFLSVWFSERFGRALLRVGCGKLGGCRALSWKVERPLKKLKGFELKSHIKLCKLLAEGPKRSINAHTSAQCTKTFNNWITHQPRSTPFSF